LPRQLAGYPTRHAVPVEPAKNARQTAPFNQNPRYHFNLFKVALLLAAALIYLHHQLYPVKMKNISKTLALWAVCVLFSQIAVAQTQKISLNDGWQFREHEGKTTGRDQWRNATVPGLVHTDLLAYKLIPDPFYRDNENKVQWVSKSEWEYRKTFTADQALLKHKNIDLVFDGLNTLADVYLDGKLILQADNMFRGWRVNIKPGLKAGSHTLDIVFHRIQPEIARLDKLHPGEGAGADTTDALVKLFADKMKQGSYVRKAAYEGGWDWGPNMVTCGIWRPVYLQAWDNDRISDLGIVQTDVTRDAAHIQADVRVIADARTNSVIKLEYSSGVQKGVLTYPITLHAGVNDIPCPINLDHPRLWYPNGYGAQDFYHIKATLLAGNKVADVAATRTGLRSVKLNTERDSLGRKFEFIVNGIPVFAKGANVIPFDHFPTRVTAARYRKFLQPAADAHMNMLRVWGGGYYETQEFYDMCDDLGIMIWQDFMFANATPPSFLKEEVATEVDYQVRRLRNHPCMAVWSGNNEITIFMENGMGVIPDAFKALLDKMKAAFTIKSYTDYMTTFEYLVPNIVSKLSPEMPYTASSPTANFEPQSSTFTSGDRHNYEVWWNNKPIESQADLKDRFVSETGIQGFPDMATIDDFTEAGDRSATSHIMNAHQKNNIVNGNTVIGKIIKTEYKEPADFASFDYLSQLVQARSLDIYAEAMRRRRPFSMGFLYWQLNDSWPVVSWSTMDSYGRPKAALYFAKHFFSPVLISPFEENGNVDVYVVSDQTETKPATLQVRLIDFNGKVLYTKKMDYTVKPLSSNIAFSVSEVELANTKYDPASSFIAVTLTDAKGEALSSNELFFKRPKDLNYVKGAVDASLSKQGDAYVLKLSSPVLAPNVAISFGDRDAWLSDNFVDVLPGEPVYIKVKSDVPFEELQKAMKVTSVNQL